MPHPCAARPAHNHIRAVFRTSAASFEPPVAATFEELAERFCCLAERHDASLTGTDTEHPHEHRKARTAAMRHLIGMDGATLPAGR